MARKGYKEEDVLRLLREIEVHLNSGMDMARPVVRQAFRIKPIIFGVVNMAVWVVPNSLNLKL